LQNARRTANNASGYRLKPWNKERDMQKEDPHPQPWPTRPQPDNRPDWEKVRKNDEVMPRERIPPADDPPSRPPDRQPPPDE
jgi:hypothetical protein